MVFAGDSSATRAFLWTARQFRRPELMAFLPALTLAAFWFGGESWLIIAAIGVPLIFAIFGSLHEVADSNPNLPQMLEGLSNRTALVEFLDRTILRARDDNRTTVAIVLSLDELERLSRQHGKQVRMTLLARATERLFAALREGDQVARLDSDSFAVVLTPVRKLDLEVVIQLASRLQGAISQPYSIEGYRVQTSAAVGFCLLQNAPRASGSAVLEAAEIAAEEAMRHGPGAIRSFSPEMSVRRSSRIEMRDTLETALDEGQIRAHFQPQVSTDTGAVMGFEALARWYHPERGLIPPGEFLPLIEETGLSEKLAEVMLHNSLSAMQRWDNAGLRVPTVAVNFSAAELRDPRLGEKLKWELDRYGLQPDRLCVEVLENVVAQNENDVIVSNIAALARMGCGIDLDDFGTGHASITSIRRFAVKRLKIDRSFVSRMDEDREQQKLVAAILSMAERLGLDTLAEGVETQGEHAMLAQLGCQAVQGFGIARPMPMEETITWMERYSAKLAEAPRIRTKSR